MTRINVIPVEELHDKHLLAEYRELPRVFNLARPCNDAPKQYVLGSGHVKFFYNKLRFLHNRQAQLIKEMQRRGFKTNFTASRLGIGKDKALWGDYNPTSEAMALNRQRINDRLKGR